MICFLNYWQFVTLGHHLQEWFSHRISEFANDLRKPIANRACSPKNDDLDSSVIVKDGTIKVLTNLALEFDDLANTCLLVLHLEVRVQCFHYLRSNEKNAKHKKSANDTLEPDSKVMKLTKVLSDMDEALNATLHPRKTKVFNNEKCIFLFLANVWII